MKRRRTPVPKLKPRRAPAPKIVWTLIRVVNEERAFIGQYATAHTGQAAAAQVMAKACGVKTIRQPTWLKRADAWELIYGRDAYSFWFRLEPSLALRKTGG